MFIMGISTYISLKKYNFTFSTPAALKIIKRTIVIFLIGIALNWFALLCYTHNPLPFEQIRILGVMQRLALCYGASALIALLLKHKYIPYLIVVLLVGYFIIPVSYTHLDVYKRQEKEMRHLAKYANMYISVWQL